MRPSKVKLAFAVFSIAALASAGSASADPPAPPAPRPSAWLGAIAGGAVGIIGLGVALGSGTSVNDVGGRGLPEYNGPAARLHATGIF